MSLSAARSSRDSLRLTLSTGIDPMETKKETAINGTVFETIANDWLKFKSANWGESYKRTQAGRLNRHILPIFGGEKITKINRADILKKIKTLEANGTHETAHRFLGMLSDIFNYAAKMGVIELESFHLKIDNAKFWYFLKTCELVSAIQSFSVVSTISSDLETIFVFRINRPK